jgi:hypothetical protein
MYPLDPYPPPCIRWIPVHHHVSVGSLSARLTQFNGGKRKKTKAERLAELQKRLAVREERVRVNRLLGLDQYDKASDKGSR